VLFTTVSVEGRPAAYHYGFLSGEDLLWYKPSFEVELSAHSPGQALLYALVEWCVETGRAGLDFTRGDEAFKRRLATEFPWNASFVFDRTPAHRWAHDALALAEKARRRLDPATAFHRRRTSAWPA
jgi:CelD/BcsL family acetyltransferase involved in cellulose biosynthesis